MSEVSSNYRVKSLKLFVILIALLLLVSCASHSPAPVFDRSKSSVIRPKTHVVIPGDTLFSIAWRYGLKYEILAKHNRIYPPYVIRPSQVIRLDIAGTGGAIAGKQQSGKGDARVSPAVTKKPVSTLKNTNNRQENRTVKSANSTSKTQAWGAPQWRWPVKGPLISSFQGSNALNKGIDLGGKLGEPVLAAAGGQVVYSGSGLRGYGKLLIVKHNETFLSAYAHNDRLLVKEGDFVKAGQRIADMGSSGTDRVKLHFEIRRDGTPVDPLKFLPRR
ncbi:peptidoglycan DD-metalloendopeptidase family protein [Cellvibrio fibrivorans]|uniref:Lipoprotein NlpD n=1 Tax=Cellvibrio fibrivorans TaxID=126350 RepID=A0ABU1UY32_9GAMM|nr:peptidoglycan DD-metalloendopeptidase family protein [Cellvibrio fibrivorans]MDR7090109.1 lipoprotein NlpD [Cellvibrio fibrivorans]